MSVLEQDRRAQRKGTKSPQAFENLGLHAIYKPFWRSLPYTNIFTCFPPDLLHQLHKGLFKDHLVKWCTRIIGADKIDVRFKAVSDYLGLHHFKKGISSVTQWTGSEHKEMQKVFVGMMAREVNDEVLTVIHAVIDFIYYTQF